VAPELEQLARPAVGGPVEQLDRVGPEPAVERHEVGALQHVDRVHLDQVHAAQHPAQVAQIGDAPWPGVGETLRGQRDAARLCDGERIRECHRRAG
jgi:hypothetical protein